MPNGDWSICALHACLDLFSSLFPQVTGISDPEAVFENFLNFFEGQARDFWVEEVDQNPADTADGSIETEGTTRSDSLSRMLVRYIHIISYLHDNDSRIGLTFIMDKKVDETIMLLPQQEQVNHMVPIARTPMGKKSQLIHAVFPTETP